MLDTEDRGEIRRLNEKADDYFRKLDDPEALFFKPYVPPMISGYNVTRLGYLLAHLRAWSGHTVLDFGAGMCWLSIVFAQMGCRVIAMDVSARALELGKRAFRRAPMPRNAYRPRFEVYDGFRMKVPDASVDRIAVYDAMHHVPNKRTVLKEMFRVLRPGGLICLIEPGPGHAHSASALAEVDEYGVLEDEIDAVQFSEMAGEVGFRTDAIVPILEPTANLFDPQTYGKLYDGPRQGVLNWPGSDAVIVLGKGNFRTDSVHPVSLRARIELVDLQPEPAPGEPFTATLNVTNEGMTVWRPLPTDTRSFDPRVLPDSGLRSWRRPKQLDYDAAFLNKKIVPGQYENRRPVTRYRRYIERNGLQGRVTLGAQLRDVDHAEVIDLDYARGFLEDMVCPGDTAQISLRMRAPSQPGVYGLQFDMVNEYVSWFGDTGSPTLLAYVNVRDAGSPADSRRPGRLAARLRVAEYERPAVLRISAENMGDTVWLARPVAGGGHVHVGVQRLDDRGAVIDRDWRRLELPHCVAPGQRADLRIDLSADEVNPDRIKVDLVAEGVAWFEDHGSEPLFPWRRPGN